MKQWHHCIANRRIIILLLSVLSFSGGPRSSSSSSSPASRSSNVHCFLGATIFKKPLPVKDQPFAYFVVTQQGHRNIACHPNPSSSKMPLHTLLDGMPALLFSFLLWWMAVGQCRAKYPNEIIDTPIVSCESDSIAIKIRTSSANPSHIYAEDFHDTAKCMVRNQNKVAFTHGECGMTTEHLDNPAGTMYRICLSVQIHPLFVTDSDRSYCAQCVYMEANLVDDLERNIAISEMTPNELDPQFDEASNPQCSYSIRKNTVDGPEVHAAVVGETVFHVWQCNNENVGILVQNCHVEDLQGDKILIIDQNGCGVDQYLFRTPQYSSDLHTAFLQSSVFKFVDKSMTRFRCQLRLCVKNRGRGCEQITPPSSCPSIDDPSDASPAPGSSSAAAGGSSSAAVLGGGSPPSLSPSAELFRSRPISPPSGRVQPPSVGRDGGSGGGLAPPPGVTLISGGTEMKAQTPKPEPVGPPSIRPFGPGRAAAGTQIVSGGKAAEQLSSNYPYYRERRSALRMLYGNGTQLARIRRETAMGSNGGGGGARSRSRADGLQELDVVGLIRVLDNPDDIQYFPDQKRSPAAPPATALPQQQQQAKTMQRIQSSRPRLQLLPRPIQSQSAPSPVADQQPPVPVGMAVQQMAAGEKHAQEMPMAQQSQKFALLSRSVVAAPPEESAQEPAEIGGQQRSPMPAAAAFEEPPASSQQTCVATATFWALALSLASLLSLQLCVVALILVDRLLLDGKYLSKKVQKVLASY